MWKPWSQFHAPDETPQFTVKSTGGYKSATERQIREALAIDSGDYNRLMNSKKEYGANCIVRQTVMFRDTVVDENTQKERENKGDDAEIAESEELQYIFVKLADHYGIELSST